MADNFGAVIKGIFGGGDAAASDRLPAANPANYFPGIDPKAGISIDAVNAIGTDIFGNFTAPKTDAATGLPVVENTAPGAQWLRDRIEESGINELGTSPFASAAAGVGDALGDVVGRGAIIILGLIFVAVGLTMFKPGVVVAAGQGFKDGVDSALSEG